MKKYPAILVAALVAAAVYGEAPAWAAGVYRGSSGIETRTVTLLTNGGYLARWDGDIGSNGFATGSWELVGGEIRLTPKKEDGPIMQGYFRVLLLRDFEGKRALLRKEDEKNSGNGLFYLFLQKKKPTQPSAPPPKSVTPAAL